MTADRDASLPVRLTGRVGAGLVEAIRIRLSERDDLDHTRESVTNWHTPKETSG